MSSLINAILPASMQTKKEGGSSASHPLAKPAEEHTPAHHHSSSSGEYDPNQRPSDMSTQQGLASGGKREAMGNEIGAGSHGTHGSTHTHSTHGNDQPLTNEGVSALAGAGVGAGVVGSGLREHEHEHERERGIEGTSGHHHGHHGGHHAQGGSGLETRDGYAAARQAGALPDRQDIRNIDRKGASERADLAGAAGGTGLVGAAAGSHGHHHQGQDHGLTAGTDDPVAMRGQAPVTEPIHDTRGPSSGQNTEYGSSRLGRDAALGGAALGGASGLGHHQGGEYGSARDAGLSGASGLGQNQGAGYGSSMTGQEAGLGGVSGFGQGERSLNQSGVGSGVRQEGLIHGHHTTITGEALDPHIGGEKRL
ncbi:hypothetical protein LTR78_004954 [Recurvomyces mirabilis]|uniref:Uncharacterized protein n=1 Tax=Recurvomyces mirabilis TaxID=574656 RepID=A0AAE0WNG6_9PEZI|nr:hypothetical protein LTR78_004954 [Recurvomyces mirabilis]KAK5158429.1 hypothetical protein LTS14_003448 [Recurvomyces mirabilis]